MQMFLRFSLRVLHTILEASLSFHFVDFLEEIIVFCQVNFDFIQTWLNLKIIINLSVNPQRFLVFI